jgi:hypothetical protein
MKYIRRWYRHYGKWAFSMATEDLMQKLMVFSTL